MNRPARKQCPRWLRPTRNLARRLLRAAEASLTVASALLFGLWTWLVFTGHTARLDRHLTPRPLAPRSILGQTVEALAFITQPVIALIIIVSLAGFSFHARMRRLAVALSVAAGGVCVEIALAFLIDRPRPRSTFFDSISYLGGAYPASHVAAVTVLAWVTVTLTRAHRRSTSLVARWALLGGGAVALTAVSQWAMGLVRVSDVIGALLLGSAIANLALTVGGIRPILAGWARLGLPAGPVDRRAAIILNPTKIDDLSLLRRRVEAEVLSCGWQPTLWLETTPDDPGYEAAARALEAGVDLVLVAGGDGTVRAVSASLAGTGTPMALLPSGTSNLLARNLGIPLDSDSALRLALRGTAHPIDVVRVRSEAGEQRFVVMAGMGLDAQIMESTNAELKRVIRSGAYAVAAVQNAIPDPFTLTVTVDDGEPTTHQAVMALLGNVGTITAGMTLFPDAEPDDGRVDLMIASPDRVVDWAKLGAQILIGREMEGFRMLSGRKIILEAATEIPFELDGDTAGTTRRLEIEAEAGALRVVMP